MSIDDGVSKRVTEARGGLSRAAAAARLGIHKNTLANYEHGSRLPDAEFLRAAHREFGISPTWVLMGEGPKYAKPGYVTGAALVDAMKAWEVKDWDEQLRRLEVDGETLTDYMAGNRLPDSAFMARFAAQTGYPLARLNQAYEASTVYAKIEEQVSDLPPGTYTQGKTGPRAKPELAAPLEEHETILLNQYRAADSGGQYLIECVCDAVAKPSLATWFRVGQALADAAAAFEKKR